jgi:hypothetical protein
VFLDNQDSPVVAFRAPAALEAEIKKIAKRDNNGLSPTVRRLLTLGIARDREQAEKRGAERWPNKHRSKRQRRARLPTRRGGL